MKVTHCQTNMSSEKLIEDYAEINKQNMIYLCDLFYQQYKPYAFSDDFKETLFKYFFDEISCADVQDALQIAMDDIPNDADKALKYFCNICCDRISYSNLLTTVANKKG